MIRKRQSIFTSWFLVFYFKQYSNRQYNQISVNIWLIFDKSAVKRHKFKRILSEIIVEKFPIKKPIKWKFYKLFFSLNKKNIGIWQKKFSQLSHQDFKAYVHDTIEKEHKFIEKKLI